MVEFMNGEHPQLNGSVCAPVQIGLLLGWLVSFIGIQGDARLWFRVGRDLVVHHTVRAVQCIM